MLKISNLLKTTLLLLATLFALNTNAAISNDPPTVTIVSPTYGQSYAGDTFVLIAANAFDSDGTIASVKFYVGKNLVGVDTSFPYRAGTLLQPGRHLVRATATDNDGNVSHAIIPVSVTTVLADLPEAEGGPTIITFP